MTVGESSPRSSISSRTRSLAGLRQAQPPTTFDPFKAGTSSTHFSYISLATAGSGTVDHSPGSTVLPVDRINGTVHSNQWQWKKVQFGGGTRTIIGCAVAEHIHPQNFSCARFQLSGKSVVASACMHFSCMIFSYVHNIMPCHGMEHGSILLHKLLPQPTGTLNLEDSVGRSKEKLQCVRKGGLAPQMNTLGGLQPP